jgi:signal transduction histidine kinase
MNLKIFNPLISKMDLFILKNKEDRNLIIKNRAFLFSWIGTDIFMWLYVLYCIFAFGPTHTVTMGGLFCTILHSTVPAILYFSQSHSLSAFVLSVTGLAFQTLFCIYNGGVYSPAAIWLALHPVILGFFGGISLLFCSIIINSSIIFLLYYFGSIGHLPIDALSVHFKDAMIVSSFIGLDILVGVFTIATIRSNAIRNEELSKNKELTENLLRILAHDINNPLTILRYYGQTLHKDPTKFSMISAERIHKASEDIQKITESVTLWISHRDGKMNLTIEPIAIEELIHHIQLTFEDRFKEKKLFLHFNLKHENRKFLGDKNAIFYQIFNNLISNAIKFSYEEGQIDFNVLVEKNSMKFEIRDRGIGINDGLSEKLFSPYTMTNRKGTNNESGTGFGLPIVGTLVKKMNGEIKIENIQKYRPSEQGTLISVQFPLAS